MISNLYERLYKKSYTEDEISNDIAIQRLAMLMPHLSVGYQVALKKAIKSLEKDKTSAQNNGEGDISNDNTKEN